LAELCSRRLRGRNGEGMGRKEKGEGNEKGQEGQEGREREGREVRTGPAIG